MVKCITCGREYDPETEEGKYADGICDKCEEARDELSNGKEEE